jgi:hypothetical protein
MRGLGVIRTMSAEGTAEKPPFHAEVGFAASKMRGFVFKDNLTFGCFLADRHKV